MKAAAWLFAVLALNVACVTDLFVAGGGFSDLGAPGGVLTALARLAGLYGALALVLQLVLVSRMPWLERPLGLDRLTGWHRWSGFWVVWLVVSHVVLMTLGYARQADAPVLDELGTLVFDTEDVLIAAIAVVLLLVIGLTSARVARKRLRYEAWHLLHLGAYAVVVLSFLHQVTQGQTFTASPVGRIYWWSVYAVTLTAVLATRAGVPLVRNLRHRFRVVAVVREAPGVITVWIGGRDLDRLPARAGQFFLWRFGNRWWEAHPYSLSAMPDGSGLRITVKALGDGSTWLQRIRPGTRVFAEGPYGAFTSQRRSKDRVLLIAGGVGITPIRALLEEFARHRDDVELVYRASVAEDVVLARELRDLSRVDGVRVHVVTGPSDAMGKYGRMMGPHHMAAMVPDVRARDVYVCGPPGMAAAVRNTLRVLGVPESQCYTEQFAFAA